ncbi:hypothetical protein [Erwinia phage Pecta]|nr:hypothetical protein [Erwinia phage Pecta]
MAWSEEDAKAYTELLCVKTVGAAFFKGNTYRVKCLHGRLWILQGAWGFTLDLDFMCRQYNPHFELKNMQLEND